ncbi:MAG: hypothetical protein JWQ73_3237 [Variovorax sp.]|nr:hypothetical protein [Variovorax sp.]
MPQQTQTGHTQSLFTADSAQAWTQRPLDGRLIDRDGGSDRCSDVEHASKHEERHAPRVAVAGVDGGRSLVDANHGAYLGLQVLVVERHLLAAAEDVSREMA